MLDLTCITVVKRLESFSSKKRRGILYKFSRYDDNDDDGDDDDDDHDDDNADFCSASTIHAEATWKDSMEMNKNYKLQALSVFFLRACVHV